MMGFNFEGGPTGGDYGDENIDLSNAAEKARRVLAKERIPMAIFRGVYSEEEIGRDLMYVKKKEAEFRDEYKKLEPGERRIHDIAKIFEAIFHQHSELSNWLGDDAVTFKASRYDDIKNGVDEIVKFGIEEDEDASYLALMVDVTVGSRGLEKKLSRIKKEIETGKLANIKYFYDDTKKEKKALNNIPRLVIGVEPKQVKELMMMWLEDDANGLAKHKVQFTILQEMYVQAQAYKDYAKKNGQEEIASFYGEVLDRVSGIIKQKEEAMGRQGESDDNIFLEIKSYLEKF